MRRKNEQSRYRKLELGAGDGALPHTSPSRDASKRAPAASPTGRQVATRARLVAGMIDAAATRGYAGASVARVLAQAGASRSTLYAHLCPAPFIGPVAANELLSGNLPRLVHPSD